MTRSRGKAASIVASMRVRSRSSPMASSARAARLGSGSATSTTSPGRSAVNSPSNRAAIASVASGNRRIMTQGETETARPDPAPEVGHERGRRIGGVVARAPARHVAAAGILQRPRDLRGGPAGDLLSPLAVRRRDVRVAGARIVRHPDHRPQSDHRAARPARRYSRAFQHLPPSRRPHRRRFCRQAAVPGLSVSPLDRTNCPANWPIPATCRTIFPRRISSAAGACARGRRNHLRVPRGKSARLRAVRRSRRAATRAAPPDGREGRA